MEKRNNDKGLMNKLFNNTFRINTPGATTITKIIESDIFLTLNQLDQVQEMHNELGRSLDTTESYLNTEIMQLEDRMPRYSPYKYPEKEKLQGKLLGLETERRRLAVEQQREEHRLQRQLLVLKNKQSQLKPPENG